MFRFSFKSKYLDLKDRIRKDPDLCHLLGGKKEEEEEEEGEEEGNYEHGKYKYANNYPINNRDYFMLYYTSISPKT
jgi:hypothetical protein